MATTDSLFSAIPRFSLAPFHLLSYSTLIGMQLWHSFAVVKICHKALPPSAFTTLQRRMFPVYFRVQTALLLITALSFPTRGPASLVGNKADWIPFAIAGLTSALNLILYGPHTSKVMVDRVHQSEWFGGLSNF